MMADDDSAIWDERVRIFSGVIAVGDERRQLRAIYELSSLSKSALDDPLSPVVPILVDLLRSPHPLVREATAFALCRLSRRTGAPFCSAISQIGTIPLILDLLPESRYRLRRPLLRLLSALVCFHTPSRATIARNRGLEIVLELVASYFDDTRIPLLEILSAMAMLRKVRRVVVNRGALPYLIEAVSVGRMASRTQAAHAIGLLGVAKRVRHLLVDKGAIPALLQLIRDGDQSVRVTACNALGVISSHVDCIHYLAEAGAIPLYMELFECSEPLGRDIAEDVFSILAVAEENAVVIVELMARILRGCDEEAKSVAVNVIWDIAGYQYSIPVVRNSGAIPLLIEILCNGNPDIKIKAIWTIAQLSCEEENRRALAEVGGVPLLLDLLKSDSEEVRDCAAKALVHFGEDPAFRDQVVQAIDIPSFSDAFGRVDHIGTSDEYTSSSMRRLSIELLTSDLDLS